MLYPVDSIRILGYRLPLYEAGEASSVIWENVAITPKQLMFNKLWVLTFIILFLMLVFMIFIYVKSYAGDFIMNFSANVNCAAMNQFMDKDKQLFLKYAGTDKVNTLRGHGTGYYQCYCTIHSSLVNTILNKDDFCYDYSRGVAVANSATYGVTILIAIVNVLLRTLNRYFTIYQDINSL